METLRSPRTSSASPPKPSNASLAAPAAGLLTQAEPYDLEPVDRATGPIHTRFGRHGSDMNIERREQDVA